jgi:hypothetical protein
MGAPSSNATLLAVRDGEGAWRQVEGQAGVYTSTVHGSYGVFIGCADADPALYDTFAPDDTRFYFRHPRRRVRGGAARLPPAQGLRQRCDRGPRL